MPRVALILPSATYRARDFVPAAKRLGVELTVVSEQPQTLAEHMDNGFLLADCSTPETAAERIVTFAAQHPLDAIVAPDDEGVLVASLAARQLGLRHNEPAAVAATRNKVQLRRALRGVIRQPIYQVADVHSDPGLVAEHVGFPVVLKPISLSASRGVIRANDADAAIAAAERIRLILARAGRSPNEPILIERFVNGPEVAVEGMLHDGEFELLAVLDKPDPLDGPYFEETLYVTPSRLHPEVQAAVVETTSAAAQTLGLEHGPVHAELRIDGSFVVLIELAVRPIGGLCGRALHFGLLRTSLEELVLKASLGIGRGRPRLGPASAGVMMLPIPRTGTLKGVTGREAALAVPGITALEVTVPVGERIEALPEGDRYLGFLFAEASDPAATEEALRAAHAQLTVTIR